MLNKGGENNHDSNNVNAHYYVIELFIMTQYWLYYTHPEELECPNAGALFDDLIDLNKLRKLPWYLVQPDLAALDDDALATEWARVAGRTCSEATCNAMLAFRYVKQVPADMESKAREIAGILGTLDQKDGE